MIHIMKFRLIFILISLVVIVPGLVSLARFGLRPGIDFTGGSLLEVELPVETTLNHDELQQDIGGVYAISSVQPSGQQRFIIRGQTIQNNQKEYVISVLTEKYGQVTELRFETVGPTLGKELLRKTLNAVILVSLLITFYIWWRFHELRFGVSAIIAMFHDSLVLLGSFSFLGHFFNVEVDVLFVTALLTTLSFSVHDTIVVFDRIREKMKKAGSIPFETVVDAAVMETLGRSLNNSITIIIMLFALAVLGGDSIRWFAVALLIGSITGTYSSTFTAAPILLLWQDIKKKFKK